MSATESLDFYTTAAQVFPLMVAVLVFDLRATVLRSGPSDHRPLSTRAVSLAPAIVILLLVVGEIAALYTLSADRATPEARRAIEAAFFGGGLVLVLSLVEFVTRPLIADVAPGAEVVMNVILILAVAGWLLCAPGGGEPVP